MKWAVQFMVEKLVGKPNRLFLGPQTDERKPPLVVEHLSEAEEFPDLQLALVTAELFLCNYPEITRIHFISEIFFEGMLAEEKPTEPQPKEPYVSGTF